MASRTVAFLAPNGANQDGQGVPGVTVTQPPGMIHYVQYEGQQFRSLNRPLQQNLQVGPMEKFLNVAKTLGVIQIFIGLIHVGLGGVLAAIWGQAYFISVAVIGGYVFWGALFFIISGSLSIAAEKQATPGLVKSSVGMNITSAIMALTGSVLLSVDLLMFNLSSCTYDHDHGREYECYFGRIINTGSSAVLLLFSLLEFCIAISTAHFGCQATCCHSDQQPVVFVPYTVSGGVVAPSEHHPPPLPAYNAEDPFPK